jgi:hypothetical protein
MYGDGHCGHAHLQPPIPTVVIDRAETEAAGTQEEEECHFKKRDAYSISDTCNPQPIGGCCSAVATCYMWLGKGKEGTVEERGGWRSRLEGEER